jgi:regulator of protease activity HflC (stomatin/prohibitin superfamily)
MEYLSLIIILVLILILLKIGVRRVTILEYEKGLKYSRGKFKKLMDSGQYWYLPFFIMIVKIDIRPRFVSITGQEVLSSDGVTLKVSLAANYEICDPNIAINKVQNYQEALYVELQLTLREIIGTTDIDTVLGNRNELSKKLKEMTEKKAQDLGLKLISVSIKDIMFPGKLKEMFAQVVNARKEGLAAIEKARGETAALRNLANAAKMIENNPNLLQLRLLQTLGISSGNTLILGMPPNTTVIPIKEKEGKEKVLPEESSEQS